MPTHGDRAFVDTRHIRLTIEATHENSTVTITENIGLSDLGCRKCRALVALHARLMLLKLHWPKHEVKGDSGQ